MTATRGYAGTPLGQLHYVRQGVGRPVLLLRVGRQCGLHLAELLRRPGVWA